jgi:excisionase family DNA binding protein
MKRNDHRNASNGPPAPVTDALLTKKQIAAELQVSTRTIEKLVKSRTIPVIAWSARVLRFDRARVRQALQRYEREEIK